MNRATRKAAASLLNAEIEQFEAWKAKDRAKRTAQSRRLLAQLKDCYALLEIQEQNVVKLILKGGQ